jgi:hypothetical protein
MSASRKLDWTWHSEWILHGDSMAGILSRFVFANALNGRLLKELITATSVMQPLGNPLYLFSTPRNDWKRFCSAISLSESALRTALLGDLLEALRWSPVVSQRFRFCPECLRFGYHARYFQILALATCPIHEAPLLDKCPSCGAVTPFYGVCNEMFGRTYCCLHCNAYFAGEQISIRTFFEPTVTSEQLIDIWRPLDDWIRAVDELDLGFAALRDWVVAYSGAYRSEREVDAVHVIATVLPLPSGRFSWKEPFLRRKSIYYHEGGWKLRAGYFEGNYIASAYADVRHGITKRISPARVTEILGRCRKESWEAVTDNSETALSPRNLAYILWRMKFENLSEPALVGAHEHKAGVFVGDDAFPFLYWNLGKPAWKLLFWAAYQGYVYDIERSIQNDGHFGDLLRGEPMRHCCFLPSTDLRGRGRGIIAYPMPLSV